MDCEVPASGVNTERIPSPMPGAEGCGCGGGCCDDGSAELLYDPRPIDLEADAPGG